MIDLLESVTATRGSRPIAPRMDSGFEFNGHELVQWATKQDVGEAFILLIMPWRTRCWEKGVFIESFANLSS